MKCCSSTHFPTRDPDKPEATGSYRGAVADSLKERLPRNRLPAVPPRRRVGGVGAVLAGDPAYRLAIAPIQSVSPSKMPISHRLDPMPPGPIFSAMITNGGSLFGKSAPPEGRSPQNPIGYLPGFAEIDVSSRGAL